MKQVFINGAFVNEANATISVFDRGLLFGDSVYEVIPVYNQRAFFVDRHLQRLFSNLDKIKIPIPQYDWHSIFQQIIAHNLDGDLQIYMQITRGNQGVRKHDIPPELEPTIILFPLHGTYSSFEQKSQGLSAKLLEDIRWSRCDIKTNSLLANVLLNDEAVSSNFQTSILVRDGIITEGSVSNIFIVTKEGLIKTPELNHFCLPGITRQIAIELANELGWQVRETNITTKELLSSAEVWMCSTTKEITPITKIDNKAVGTGSAGNYWKQIDHLFQKLKT